MTNEVLLHEIGLLRNILRVQYVSELIQRGLSIKVKNIFLCINKPKS